MARPGSNARQKARQRIMVGFVHERRGMESLFLPLPLSHFMGCLQSSNQSANKSLESDHFFVNDQPAAATISRMRAGAYLLLFSVWMVSPRAKRTGWPATNTVCDTRLTRCISIRLSAAFQ